VAGLTEFTELVPEPGSGRVFTHELTPGIADAGGDQRARLDAVARWLQDVAYYDLRDAGFSAEGVWVLRRTRIRVESWPRWPEPVELRTFCSGIGRFTAERRTSIRGGGAGVETVALWVWLDPTTLTPRRFPDRFHELYGVTADGRKADRRLRHPDPPADAARRPWAFRAADVDVAAHVNNSHYWVPLEEELAGGEVTALDAEIEYRDPAQPGEMMLLAEGSARWIVSSDGTVHASIMLGEHV
jgi:acyl-ACP thioesterase